ncbi:MAG: TetR/AcrR family transcriptional regulator [Hyphomonadaceae bacterium]|nr:TetR/AcrR family transcriptional regulator [Hyphomonadaceae bacterium]
MKGPTAAKPAARSERRKNADRSAATRRQILEATVRCLDAWGYGAVTNIKVADEAGVSRGAMMHHFPTRQALIVATVEYAHEKLSEFRRNELEKYAPGLPRFRAIVDMSVVTQTLPEGMACNEVRIGSRSDPEIRAAVTPTMSFISDEYGRLVASLAREAGLHPNREVKALTATMAMAARALAINTFTYPRGNIDESVIWMIRNIREDIIARQLGEKAAERPEPLPEERKKKETEA